MSQRNVCLARRTIAAYNDYDVETFIARCDPGETRIEPETDFDLGDRTLHFYLLHGRGRHSGVEVAMPCALVVDWRDSLAVQIKAYAHREDALEDLGMSEDELEPSEQ